MKLYEAIEKLKQYPYMVKFVVYTNKKNKRKLTIRFYPKQGTFHNSDQIDEALEHLFPDLNPMKADTEFLEEFNYVYVRANLEKDPFEHYGNYTINFSSRKPFTNHK